MLRSLGHKNTAVFSLTVMTALLVAGCSSSGDDGPSVGASQQMYEGFEISSTEFSNVRPRKRIPNKSTCHGGDVSPPLTWKGWPDGTQSFVLISEDVDHETGIWVHWVLYDIPIGVSELSAGIPTSTETLPDGTTQGTNDFRNIGYNGPCQALKTRHFSFSGDVRVAMHRYYFRLYALDTTLEIGVGAIKSEVMSAMEGHILGQTETVGRNSPPVTLTTKGGRGFLETRATGVAVIKQDTWGELGTPTPTTR